MSQGLWALVVLIILLSALLSVWFSDEEKLMRLSGKTLRNPRTNKRRMRVYAKLALNSILQKGMVSPMDLLGGSQLVSAHFS